MFLLLLAAEPCQATGLPAQNFHHELRKVEGRLTR